MSLLGQKNILRQKLADIHFIFMALHWELTTIYLITKPTVML